MRSSFRDSGNIQGDNIKETACNGVGWIYLDQQAFTDLIMKYQVLH
jgi:hypothetical protein